MGRHFIAIITSCFIASQAVAFTLTPTAFANLPGWQSDQQAQALSALKRSCRIILKQSQDKNLGSRELTLHEKEWDTSCHAALKEPAHNNRQARRFFQHYFTAYAVEHNETGLFTGYYLPEIPGSLHKTKRFSAPLYARPDNLISVKLDDFNPQWHGKTLVGKRVGNRLLPYNTPRYAINQGALKNHAKIIAWTDPIDRFILQIQGSGYLRLPNKKKLLLGFNGKNGSAYTAIGRLLVEQKQMNPKTASMQKIRAWMMQHPHRAQALMNQNASFVFFKRMPTQAVIGTQQAPLTPQRSLAVDQRYIPLGAPIWLSSTYPCHRNKACTLQRLMIAQDTGGAIKGAVRGDVYWGSGNRAEWIAGHMRSKGKYWVLLPKTLR